MLWRVDVSESHVRIMLCRWESRRYGFGTLQDSRVEMEARQSLMINDRIYCGLLMHENGYRRRNWCCLSKIWITRTGNAVSKLQVCQIPRLHSVQRWTNLQDEAVPDLYFQFCISSRWNVDFRCNLCLMSKCLLWGGSTSPRETTRLIQGHGLALLHSGFNRCLLNLKQTGFNTFPNPSAADVILQSGHGEMVSK